MLLLQTRVASPVFVTVSVSASSLCALITRLNKQGLQWLQADNTTMAISAEVSNPSSSITVTVAINARPLPRRYGQG